MANCIYTFSLFGKVTNNQLAELSVILDGCGDGGYLINDVGNIDIDRERCGTEDSMSEFLDYLMENSIRHEYTGYATTSDIYYYTRWTPEEGTVELNVDDSGNQVVSLDKIREILAKLESNKSYTGDELLKAFYTGINMYEMPKFEVV